MDESTMIYICRYCIFTLWGRGVLKGGAPPQKCQSKGGKMRKKLKTLETNQNDHIAVTSDPKLMS